MGDMVDGFAVNTDALRAVGSGAAELINELGRHRVEDLACDSGSVGHEPLASALASFCNRWQVGVRNLSTDGNQLSEKVSHAAQSYEAHDQECADALRELTEQLGNG